MLLTTLFRYSNILIEISFKLSEKGEYYMQQITLKAARINAGFSQCDAAKEINVATSTLRNWENGKTYPKQNYIELLCRLYGVTYENIFFGSRLAKS